MHLILLPVLLTLAAALTLSVYVAFLRQKTTFHWLLVGLLLGTAVWTTGTLTRLSATTESGLHAALVLVFAGILSTAPLWLLVCAWSARRTALFRPGSIALLCLPPALLYLALLTNEGHQLFLREVSFRAMEAGPAAFAGPLFWWMLVYAYACVALGLVIYLRALPRLTNGPARRMGWMHAAAAILPVASSTLYVFQIVPVPVDTTPVGLMASMVLVFVAVFRYQLLESLPLAHRDVVANLEDGIVMADASGAIVDWNPAAAQIFDRAARAAGSDPGGVPDAAGLVRGGALSALLERFDPVTTPMVEVHDEAVPDLSGEAVGRFAILRDRTEERRYEQMVRRGQRLETVGALAGGIAHEVNDPVAFVRSNLHHVLRMADRIAEVEASSATSGEADRALAEELVDLRAIAEETLDGVERIARIAEDMQRLTPESEQIFSTVDLRAVIEDALRLAQLRSDDAPPVGVHVPDSTPAVMGSPERLVQVLLNLLSNARQALAGREDGCITVDVRSDLDHVEVAVEDNGPGVPREVHERIFDPFFTTKGPESGMGLGLAIAFDIAREHGGALEERSRTGSGARFVLRLPALA
jgi:signal transduction histidine kinase